MIAKLKEEQKRKLATLAGQYESTIESLVRDLTVKLESWQVRIWFCFEFQDNPFIICLFGMDCFCPTTK